MQTQVRGMSHEDEKEALLLLAIMLVFEKHKDRTCNSHGEEDEIIFLTLLLPAISEFGDRVMGGVVDLSK